MAETKKAASKAETPSKPAPAKRIGIRLSIPKEPQWIELLEGVRIKINPVTAIEQSAARAYARRVRNEIVGGNGSVKALGGEVTGVPDQEDPDMASASEDLLYAQGLARNIILEWEGVLDDEGEPAPVSPEAIDVFMRLPYIGELFLNTVQGEMLKIFDEGNAFGPAPSGGSGAGPSTAGDAENTTSPAAEESEE